MSKNKTSIRKTLNLIYLGLTTKQGFSQAKAENLCGDIEAHLILGSPLGDAPVEPPQENNGFEHLLGIGKN